MDMFSKVAAIAFAAFLIWMLVKYLRSNPESLSWANINKSMFSMGILAAILIAFVAVVIMLLRRT